MARGVRGHFLVDSVLNALISSITFGFSLDIHCAEGTDETGEEETEAEHTVNDSAPGEPSRLSEHEDPPPDRHATNGTETEQTCLYSALALFDKVLNKKMAVEELDDSPELIKIEQMLLQTKEHLQGQRMAKLWLQYMNMIDIMRRFLRAEPRTTDLPPAPEALLRVVRCNCKKDCQSKRCTCRKHGLVCSVACGGCKWLSCTNSPSFEELDSDLLDIPSVFGLPDLAEDMDVVLPLDTDS